MILSLLFSVLLLTSIACAKGEKSDPIGKWTGVSKDADGNRIPVELTVERINGSLECELDYGPDRHCTSNAVSAGSEGGLFYFRFNRGHGGWCDRLTDGEMTLQFKADGKLELRVKHMDIDESVVLERK
jgi:hypothetical protein